MQDDNGLLERSTARLHATLWQRDEREHWRRPAAIAVGMVGVALYNWWLPVALFGNLLATPDELFSDLEATGRHDAALLQHLDLSAGLLLLAALLIRGRMGPSGRRAEWPWLVAWAVAGAVGGHFAYACPEGLSASCRAAEWHLALPPHHYVHVVAGIAEFAFATTAITKAWLRTRSSERPSSWVIQWIGRVLLLAYPLLAVTYLTDRYGAFVEPIFFMCFSLMVLVELFERPGGPHLVTGFDVQDLTRSMPIDRLTSVSPSTRICSPR